MTKDDPAAATLALSPEEYRKAKGALLAGAAPAPKPDAGTKQASAMDATEYAEAVSAYVRGK